MRVVVLALVWVVGRLGVVRASNVGGWLGRLVGPWLGASRVADGNLRWALPGLDAAGRRRVVRAVWDNLGRNAAELPYLGGLKQTDAGPGWEIEGLGHLEALGGQPVLFFSGHIGNWEMLMVVAGQLGLPVAGVYRAASDAGVDGVIQGLRGRATGGLPLFAKGAGGARAALRHLAGGGVAGAAGGPEDE